MWNDVKMKAFFFCIQYFNKALCTDDIILFTRISERDKKCCVTHARPVVAMFLRYMPVQQTGNTIHGTIIIDWTHQTQCAWCHRFTNSQNDNSIFFQTFSNVVLCHFCVNECVKCAKTKSVSLLCKHSFSCNARYECFTGNTYNTNA